MRDLTLFGADERRMSAGRLLCVVRAATAGSGRLVLSGKGVGETALSFTVGE
jgi:hypothetical protein